MGNITRNFSDHEFACQCGCGTGEINRDLVRVLQEVSDNFKKPVTITSGIRCEKHNANVGGAEMSQHITGKADDFQVKDVEPSVVYKWLTEQYPKTYGMGLYSRWVHLDVRQVKARWDKT